MKTIQKSIFLAMIALILGACETDDSANNDDQMTAQEIEEANTIANSGVWIITNYNDDGQDETSDFNGYIFTFDNAGVLRATNGTTTLTGAWSVTEDSSNSSDDDNDDIDFNIFFPVSDDHDFDDLSDDWDIVSIDATSINLIDVSGGNGGTDRLTFMKN
jgi:hypothetical protein